MHRRGGETYRSGDSDDVHLGSSLDPSVERGIDAITALVVGIGSGADTVQDSVPPVDPGSCPVSNGIWQVSRSDRLTTDGGKQVSTSGPGDVCIVRSGDVARELGADSVMV